jgi:lipoteichoic acid synthase
MEYVDYVEFIDHARLPTYHVKLVIYMKMNIGVKRWTNHFAVISTLLIVKFALVRYLLFDDANLVRDVFVEAGGILLLSSLIELLFGRKRWVGVVYFIYNALCSAFLFSLVMYFNAFSRIYTYHALTEIRMLGSVTDSGTMGMLFHPWYLVLFLDLPVILVLAVLRKYGIRNLQISRKKMCIVAVAGIALSLINMARGYEYANDVTAFADDAGILNAEAFQVYESQRQADINPRQITQTNIDRLKGISEPAHPKYFGIAKGKNLIIIQMESIPNFVIGAKVGGVEVTPTLNSLVKSELYFRNWTTEIGQGHTSDAEIITNTSLYPLEEGSLFQADPTKNFPSLPKLLNKAGYKTMALHTNDITFYNRYVVYPSLGFQTYYDMKYFGLEDQISYAASDDVLFKKSLTLFQQQQKKGQPFYAFMVTLSSHEPFDLPAKYQTLPMTNAVKGTEVGKFLSAAHYADAALGRFIDNLKKDGLWNNSVVVIYGDHFPFTDEWYQKNPAEQSAFTSAVGHPEDIVDMYNIAGIMHVPGMKHQVIDMPGGEIDTLPTVANLLGIKLNQIHFGEDVLNQSYNLLGFRYYEPDGTFEDNHVLYNPTTKIAVDVDTRNTVPTTPDIEKRSEDIAKLEAMSSVYLEHLPDRQ